MGCLAAACATVPRYRSGRALSGAGPRAVAGGGLGLVTGRRGSDGGLMVDGTQLKIIVRDVA